MPRVDSALRLLDSAAEWLLGLLDGLPVRVQHLAVLPVLMLAAYVALRIVVRRVVPWSVRYVVRPVILAVVGAIVLIVLLVDFMLAMVFRLLWLPLTVLHYAPGDLAVGGAAWATDGVGVLVTGARRLRRFSLRVLFLAAGALVAWWNAGYCGRTTAAACISPAHTWFLHVQALF